MAPDIKYIKEWLKKQTNERMDVVHSFGRNRIRIWWPRTPNKLTPRNTVVDWLDTRARCSFVWWTLNELLRVSGETGVIMWECEALYKNGTFLLWSLTVPIGYTNLDRMQEYFVYKTCIFDIWPTHSYVHFLTCAGARLIIGSARLKPPNTLIQAYI
jgi:hypothetical protein